MLRLTSLRARLLLGSILWSIGLLFVAHLVAVFVVHGIFDSGPLVITRRGFRIFLAVAVVVATIGMIAGFRQVRRGLSALDRLKAALAAVRDGRERRLVGTYPSEVAPLVADLNALLDHREEVVRRALAKAGDLAHGLKTPLAVVAREAERASADGEPELAATLAAQVDRMQRQIQVHLAQARAAGAGATLGARASVRDAADALVRTLGRLHAERGLTFVVDVPAEHAIRGESEDLEEMLGNLLDNACTWARSRVHLAAAREGDQVVVTVDDDGPGLAPELRERVLQRGVRADESAPGSGLGLAIVRDLAELYGGSVALDRSPEGGLRTRLALPAA